MQKISVYLYSIITTAILVQFTYNGYTQSIQNTGDIEFASAESAVKVIQQKADPDLEIIRKRIVDDLLQPAVDVKQISELIKTIQPDGSWPGINYKDTSRTGFQHSEHLQNMLALSRAYKKPGTEFYKNPLTKKTVSSALDFWISHDFICENWWWNEMGTPNWMINTMLVLDEELTDQQRKEGARIASRASLEAFGARPGGDLIQIAGMLGKQGLFKRDETILERVVKVMASEIKTTTGRGLKPDMSFHHRTDNVISTLSYGTGYASSFSYWAVKTAGTKYAFPEQPMKLLIDYYLNGISRSMAFGKYPDIGAKNRDLSRKATLSPASPEIVENLLKASNYRKDELEELLQIRKSGKKPNYTWNQFFWHSEYFTHQRPQWFSSVRMHSIRQNNIEAPYNEEGLKNHHFADGSNFITITGREYFDIFPVWNWQKIPGTTVVQKPELPHWNQIVKKGLSEFVGAVTDGKYGAAAFDFSSPHDPLKARKAWFFFDREFVCLGAGISSESPHSVFTTINQSLLNTEVLVNADKKSSTLSKGEHKLKSVSWVLHDNVAYLFPTGSTVDISNKIQTGNWRQLNHHTWATEEVVEKEIFSLWIDHDSRPRNSKYEYIVVPGIAPTAIEKYNKNEITILSNSDQLQAVQHKTLGITQIVFYKEGSIKINNGVTVTTKSPCILLFKTNGNTLDKMVLSDPTRKLQSITVMLTAQVHGSGSQWSSTWDKNSKSSVIEITLPKDEFAGSSIVLELKK
jgi:chondroitin AC lyase